MNKQPTFILKLEFQCRYHQNYCGPTDVEIFHSLSIVSSGDLGLTLEECKALCNKILNFK
jgi:hypothetical protein